MAARPSTINEYEQKRLDRIAANQAKLGSIGIEQHKFLLELSLQAVRCPAKPKATKVKGATPATRCSRRLQKADAEHAGLQQFPDEGKTTAFRQDHKTENASWLRSKERRCGQKGRGSIYDSIAGITCHFCRQKKLCGEQDCQRCSERNVEQDCIGKSECSKCGSACGRFCRACLLVRYGLQLEAVREQMAAGAWLCPHCYEEDHPEEDWICNSSICMTRRGLKPTGIAIFEAQQQGFASVAHYVQAQLVAKGGRKTAAAAKPNTVQDSVTEVLSRPAENAAEAASECEGAELQAANAEIDASSLTVQASRRKSTAAAAAADGLCEAAALGHDRSGQTSGSDGSHEPEGLPAQGKVQSSTANALMHCVVCRNIDAAPAAVQSGTCAATGKAGIGSSSWEEAGKSADDLHDATGCMHKRVLLGGPELHNRKKLPASSAVANKMVQDKMTKHTKTLLQRGLDQHAVACHDAALDGKARTEVKAKTSILSYVVPLRRSARHAT